MLEFHPFNGRKEEGCDLFLAYIDESQKFYFVRYTLGDDIHWSASYHNNEYIAKFISNKLRLEGRYGYGVPSECRFATKEEAMAICERHYKLLILQ